MSVLSCRDVEVVHHGDVRALAGVDVDVKSGQSLALLGRSGSGKTTLLHVLAGLVPPTRGAVERSGTTSLVFQGANLLPQFTAVENVGFAAQNGANPGWLLDLVGLDGQLDQLAGATFFGAALATLLAARAIRRLPLGSILREE